MGAEKEIKVWAERKERFGPKRKIGSGRKERKVRAERKYRSGGKERKYRFGRKGKEI